MTRPLGDMSIKTFKLSLKLSKELSIPEVWLHNWGEPLLHPQLLKYVYMACEQFRVGFATNGKLLTHELLVKLSERGLTYLDISINKNTKWTYLTQALHHYELANYLGIDCRIRSAVYNKEEYDYLQTILRNVKIRWQRAMIRDETRIRNKDCQARKHVFVILWDGTVVPCCGIVNKEIVYGVVGKPLNMELDVLTNEYCKHCFEVEDKMPVRFKL